MASLKASIVLAAAVVAGVGGCAQKQSLSAPDHEVASAGASEELALDLGGGVTMKCVRMPAGAFRMGSPAGETDRGRDEGPQHEVTISRPFYMGACEVTQAQYEQVMGGNPSHFKGAGAPVETVSWNDAVEFCRRLSRRAGRDVRLPTEAEWEYACRAGNQGRFPFGDDEGALAEHAWYAANSDGRTHGVGGKRPNAWGLYDMQGNVWEWCVDWHASNSYAGAATVDPQGPSSGSARVLRGGCWGSLPRLCRSAARGRGSPAYRSGDYGFRVVVSATQAE